MVWDSATENFFRRVFNDLTVDYEENEELKEKFQAMNPPPDKLVWIRAAAFRIGCEFLSDDGSDKGADIALLRCINVIVHALETTCMM